MTESHGNENLITPEIEQESIYPVSNIITPLLILSALNSVSHSSKGIY